jgi:hypothetical protein
VKPADTFVGFAAARLHNGLISAALVPDVGGRILQFWLGEHPFFFVNRNLAGRLFTPAENWGDGTMSSWKNYGGNKTWPAPQGWDGPDRWAGPPDPILDSGRFELLEADRLRAVVQSPTDHRTGLQITRELELERNAARATLRRTMRNLSQRNVRWSLWDVTQLDCASDVDTVRTSCVMTLPLNPASDLPGGYSVLYGPDDNAQWSTARPELLDVHYTGALGKVGADSQAGWVAFADADGDWVFTHQFAVSPGAEYPDRGATVEVWTQGPGVAAGVDFGQPHLRGLFMEMEVLGPLVELAPGEASSMDLVFAACRCPGPIVDVTAEVSCSRPLALHRLEHQLRVSATYGVFEAGRMQLRDADGGVLLERPVTPLEPLELDTLVPEGTRSVELALLRGSAPPLVIATAAV